METINRPNLANFTPKLFDAEREAIKSKVIRKSLIISLSDTGTRIINGTFKNPDAEPRIFFSIFQPETVSSESPEIKTTILSTPINNSDLIEPMIKVISVLQGEPDFSYNRNPGDYSVEWVQCGKYKRWIEVNNLFNNAQTFPRGSVIFKPGAPEYF